MKIYNQKRWIIFIGLLLFTGLISSCAGIKPYPNTLTKNITIKTSSKGGFLTSINVQVHIAKVNKNCQGEYIGTVKLKNPVEKVGLPTGKWSYLTFNFATSTFLGGNNSSISLGTLIKPRKGYTYELDVSYFENIYNVEIFEKGPRGKKAREIDIRNLEDC
jgi:hypothetical protein